LFKVDEKPHMYT